MKETMINAPALPRLVLADDLSGAAEAAACFGPGSVVRLWADGVSAAPVPGHVAVLDLDSRRLSGREAAAVSNAALAAVPADAGLMFKKIDSLLRGNVAAELGQVLADGRTVFVAPALPALHRTTAGGVIHVQGVPLHETELWAAEARATPRSVAEALQPLTARVIPLAAVRAGTEAILAELTDAPGLYVCDAETHADLATIAAAAQACDAVLAGSAGICRAVSEPTPDLEGAGAPWARPCLTVVGTASPTAAAQAALLSAETGAAVLCVTLAGIEDPHVRTQRAAELAKGLAEGRDLIVTLEPLVPERRLPGPVAAAALAEIVRLGLATPGAPVPDLILTGGETARSVLNELDVHELVVAGQAEPGAVVSRTAGGRSIGTRPGSFGGPDSLLRLRRAINRLATSLPSTPSDRH